VEAYGLVVGSPLAAESPQLYVEGYCREPIISNQIQRLRGVNYGEIQCLKDLHLAGYIHR